jgi:hypothetical protein
VTKYFECYKCLSHCLLRGFDDNEPCWGYVEEVETCEVIEGTLTILHSCIGHREEILHNKKYIPKPEDTEE